MGIVHLPLGPRKLFICATHVTPHAKAPTVGNSPHAKSTTHDGKWPRWEMAASAAQQAATLDTHRKKFFLKKSDSGYSRSTTPIRKVHSSAKNSSYPHKKLIKNSSYPHKKPTVTIITNKLFFKIILRKNLTRSDSNRPRTKGVFFTC